jgi:hypothetical protein
MKKFLKFVWVIPIVLILFTMFYYPLSINALFGDVIIDGNSGANTTNVDYLQSGGYSGERTYCDSWVATQTSQINSISVQIERPSVNFSDGEIYIAVFEGVNPAVGTLVSWGNLYYGSIPADVMSYKTFILHPFLELATHHYCFEIMTQGYMQIEVGCTQDQVQNISLVSYPAYGDGIVGIGNGFYEDLGLLNNWYTSMANGRQIMFYTMGATGGLTTIETQSATMGSNPGEVILHGKILLLGVGETIVHCYFEWGETTIYECGETTIVDVTSAFTQFNVTLTNLPQEGTIHFKAFVLCPVSGLTIAGSDRGFTWSGSNGGEIPPDVTYIITSNVTDVQYTTAIFNCELKQVGSEGALTINMIYDTTPNLDDSHGTKLEMASTVDTEGNFTSKVTGLTANTQYFYVAEALGQNPYYGEIKTFTTSDPSKPSGVNWINHFFDNHGLGRGIWWIIIFALMLLPWLLKPIRENKQIGLILDLLILGAGIALVLDPWIVILLAFGAGITIFALIMKNRQGA